MASPVSTAPRLLIQCDWNLSLRDVGGEAWISCIAKDSAGTHGKIRTIKSLPDSPSVVSTDGFKVEKVSSNAITINHSASPYTCVFIAPHHVYSNIHKGYVSSIDVNDEGLVTSSSQDQLHVWDFKSEELKLSLKGHAFYIYKCRFFPSGSVVLSCSSDMTVKIWCAKTGRCPVTLKGHSRAVTDVAFVDRGKNILSTSKDGKLKLWNCGDSSCIADIVSVSSSINCCLIVDAPALIPGDMVNSKDKREVGTKNKVVFIGCEDGTLQGIALAARKSIYFSSFNSPINALAFVEDAIVIGCQDGSVTLCSLNNLQNRKTWYESNSSVLSLLPFKNIGVFISRQEGSVEMITLKESHKRISLTGSNFDPVDDMCLNETHIFTCCRDGNVRSYLVDTVLSYL